MVLFYNQYEAKVCIPQICRVKIVDSRICICFIGVCGRVHRLRTSFSGLYSFRIILTKAASYVVVRCSVVTINGAVAYPLGCTPQTWLGHTSRKMSAPERYTLWSKYSTITQKNPASSFGKRQGQRSIIQKHYIDVAKNDCLDPILHG